MRVRIRRFTKNGADEFALDFPLSRAEDGSTLCKTPTGFTRFDSAVVPLSVVFGLWSSSCELLIVFILSVFSPSQQELIHAGTMASADPCHLSLTSRSGLL
jgi:hypothetical protein